MLVLDAAGDAGCNHLVVFTRSTTVKFQGFKSGGIDLRYLNTYVASLGVSPSDNMNC